MDKKYIILNMLLAGWIIGLSGRFVVEFLIRNMASYTPNLFDMIFDWSGLFLLGSINFIYFLHNFYSDRMAKLGRGGD